MAASLLRLARHQDDHLGLAVEEMERDPAEPQASDIGQAPGAEARDGVRVSVERPPDGGDGVHVPFDVEIDRDARLFDGGHPAADTALGLVAPAVRVGLGYELHKWLEREHRGDTDGESGGQVGDEVRGCQTLR